ncbi:MAG: hypothetical protein AAF236_13170, partial [Verrucomicrobiota bacterium]
FGKTFARIEIGLFCFLPILLWIPLAGSIRWEPVWIVIFLVAQFAVFLINSVVSHEPGPVYNRLLAVAALQLIAYAVAITLHVAFRA